jgi:hypothetical protein
MKLSRILTSVAMASGLAISAMSASAAIVNNGNGTFTDTATGLLWMNLSTFYGSDHAQDQALLLPGFQFATQAQTDQLEVDTGLTASTPDAIFIAVAAAMGVPTPTPYGRELIWGEYGDGSNWAFIFGPEDSGDGWHDAFAYVPSWPDEGAFAVGGSAVPEPGVWTMMLLGLGGAGLAMRAARKSGSAITA